MNGSNGLIRAKTLDGGVSEDRIITSCFLFYAVKRRVSTKGTGLKIGKDFHTAHVLAHLIKDNHWSPAAALGYATHHHLIDTVVSVPTLYSYIKAGILNITEQHLPRAGKQRKRKAKQYKRSYAKLRGVSIEQRPKSILNRKEFGHWEGDLIMGAQGTKAVCLTLLERKTRYVFVTRFNSKHAYHVTDYLDYLERRFGKKFPLIFKSITFDNGTEFSNFKEMERSQFKNRQRHGKRTQIYYAHPYCSSERGSNENCNQLLRRAGFNKRSNLGMLSKRQVVKFTRWVNNLPRKILGFHSAQEMFVEELKHLSA